MKKRKLLMGLLAASFALGIATVTSCTENNKESGTSAVVESSATESTPESSVEPGSTSSEAETSTTPEAAKLASLKVEGADNETCEYGKEYMPSSGIKVSAIYSDGKAEDVSDKVEYSISKVDASGSKTVTVSYQDVTAKYKVSVVKFEKTSVADGKISMNGTEYETIAKAFAAIPADSKDVYTITLGKGTYNENGLTYNGSATVRIVGSTDAKYGADVVIKGHGSKMPGETGCDSRNRCLISIQGSASIILENVTLESDWLRKDHSGDVQAEVLGTDTTGNTAAYNCGFKSHQDTLRTIGKAWFYGCYIEGDVDFIWMEAGGKVALYEECEIVSVWDQYANTHNTYLTAPKMAQTLKLGKGLVIYNCNVHESEEAKANGQKTYMARTPWSSGCYNQVTYINSTVSDIETSDGPWYKTQIATPYAKTLVGWKMDEATAQSVGITDIDKKDYILNNELIASEYNGRKAILNRLLDTGKLVYVTDSTTNWDIEELIAANGWKVTEDTSVDKPATDTMGDPTVYNFKVETVDGVVCEGFQYQENSGNTHYVGVQDQTITVPINGKCYVEVYGYYAGTAEATVDTQPGKMVMFFNNNTTGSEVENDFIVYDENATSFTLTALDTTYITRIVVIPDSSIEEKLAEEVTITGLKPKQIVGVPQTLKAEISPTGVLNTTVTWSSSDETIATVNPYTGKVTFLKEGKVTITATANDGSGKSASIECNPFTPTWTAIEWYTKDTDVVNETGADGVDMFDTNSSANKSLSNTYTFTNLAGETISSKYGLKLNSAGKLSFATLKYAEVSLIVAPKQNNLVNPPTITNVDGSKAVLLSQYVDEATGLQYFKYALTATGMWDIERSDVTVENNPILYAKVEYVSTDISESVGVTFKGSHYTTGKTGIDTIIEPGSPLDATDTTAEFYKMKLTNCCSNGAANNWLRFLSGAKIEFTVTGSCTLLVGYYSKLQTIKLDGEVIEGNKTSVYNGAGEIVEYELPHGGVVTIEASANDYLGFVGVVFRSLDDKKTIALEDLDKTYPAKNYTKNENYETTLETAKKAINDATTEAELATAIANAKTAMDALEVDPVEEVTGPVKTLNYVYSENANGASAGTPVVSTKEITFTGCEEHDGKNQYIALKNGNSIKMTLALGAILVVEMPYTQGTVTVNGTSYELTGSATGKITYVVEKEGEVTISGPAGKAYVTSISVVTPVRALSYTYSLVAGGAAAGQAVASTDDITFVGCVEHNGEGQYIALKESNSVSINLAAGATLTVYMPYTNGTVTINGKEYALTGAVDGKVVYVAAEAGVVTLTGPAGNAYITKITVSSPIKTLNYVYKANANGAASGTAVSSTDEITFAGCVEHDGSGAYIALKDSNSVVMNLTAGTTLVVFMPYTQGTVDINGKEYTLTGAADGKVEYVVTASGEVKITGPAGKAYITQIVVLSPVEKLAYTYSAVAGGAAAGAAVASTDDIVFNGCVEHNGDGQYIALKDNNAVLVNLKAGATLSVAMPYTNGTVTVNGKEYALTGAADGKIEYTATSAGVVILTGPAGKAYITSITVSSPVSSLVYTYSSVANGAAAGQAVASTDEITFTGCVEHNGNGQYIALKEGNSVSINLAAGVKLVVEMPYTNGTVKVNEKEYTLTNAADGKIEYTTTEAGIVTLTGPAGNGYITKTTVTKAE